MLTHAPSANVCQERPAACGLAGTQGDNQARTGRQTIQQVNEAGLTAEALGAERLEFRYNALAGEECPIRYGLEGERMPVPSSLLTALLEQPKSTPATHYLPGCACELRLA